MVKTEDLITRQVQNPSVSPGLKLVIGVIAMLAIGVSALWIAKRSMPKPPPVGELGMIRPPSRWDTPWHVTYRLNEPNTVVVAAPPTPASWPGLEYGDHCIVQGSTVIRMIAFHDNDVLVEILRLADPRAVFLEGDCPPGTMFILSWWEAHLTLNYWHIYDAQRDRDCTLLRGRLPFEAMRR